ncbi:hypothetical protein [Teredinibacter turnerae]|uniref:hypothetical protein n=1 Tax=Teredinibacter turnerae TaxID=2426 RepID=UPI0030CCA3FB
MSKKKKVTDGKQGLVVGTTPDRYRLVDNRLMKPVCHQSYEGGALKGSMLIQDIDKVSLNKKSNITYFVPNNIALLLSVCEKSLQEAKNIHAKYFSNKEIELDLEKMTGDRKEMMNSASSLVCDYLESIQTSIVFGYTAVEAFVNLSIPDGYEYTTEKNNKGISEIFDKKAIERWLPLRVKVKSILAGIYNTKNPEPQKWWGLFLNLESYRNEIIHQKSISHTEFYKVYFKQSIFRVCQSPVELIAFFHDSHAEESKTNPLWPWLEGMETLPVNREYDSSKFEVVGNMYEGIKK